MRIQVNQNHMQLDDLQNNNANIKYSQHELIYKIQ